MSTDGAGQALTIHMRTTGPTDGEIKKLLDLAYKTSFRILGSRESAEDIAQTAVSRAVARWSATANFAEAWTARVATNEAISLIRRSKRRPLAVTVAQPAHDQASVQRLHVQRLLLQLPKRQREVVALRFLADLSVHQVADLLNLSEGSVKTHAHRGLASLREAIETDTDEPSTLPTNEMEGHDHVR